MVDQKLHAISDVGKERSQGEEALVDRGSMGGVVGFERSLVEVEEGERERLCVGEHFEVLQVGLSRKRQVHQLRAELLDFLGVLGGQINKRHFCQQTTLYYSEFEMFVCQHFQKNSNTPKHSSTGP